MQATPEFKEHPAVINGFSELMRDVFGPEAGVGARSALGVASIPAGWAVEIEAIFEVDEHQVQHRRHCFVVDPRQTRSDNLDRASLRCDVQFGRHDRRRRFAVVHERAVAAEALGFFQRFFQELQQVRRPCGSAATWVSAQVTVA